MNNLLNQQPQENDYHSIVFDPIEEGYTKHIADVIRYLDDTNKADLKHLEVGKVYILKTDYIHDYVKLIQKPPSGTGKYIFISEFYVFEISIGNLRNKDGTDSDTLIFTNIEYGTKHGVPEIVNDISNVTLYESNTVKNPTTGGRKSKKSKKTRKARKNRKARKSRKHTKR